MRPSGIPPPRRNQSAQAVLGASLGQRLYILSKVGNPQKTHYLATPCRLGRLIPTGWGDSAWPHSLPPRSGGVSLQKRSRKSTFGGGFRSASRVTTSTWAIYSPGKRLGPRPKSHPFVRKGNALMALLCESCRYLRLGVGASGGDVSTCVRVYANKWSGGYLLAVLISSWRAGSRPPQRTDS